MEKKVYKKSISKDIEVMLLNPFYAKYYEQKQEIVQRYPPQKERTREEHLEFIKEVGNLMWETDGAFQEFLWDAMSEFEKLQQERKATSRKRGPRGKYNEQDDE